MPGRLPLEGNGIITFDFVSFKGQSHEIFCSRSFPQTAPPGPIRDVLGPF